MNLIVHECKMFEFFFLLLYLIYVLCSNEINRFKSFIYVSKYMYVFLIKLSIRRKNFFEKTLFSYSISLRNSSLVHRNELRLSSFYNAIKHGVMFLEKRG